jgi:ferritin-like protein
MHPDTYTTEAIQQAIAQGAITEAYQADPQQVIQELNRLRATEVTSYLQYKQHAYMAVSLFAPGLKDDFEAHATLELQHADLLAQRIQQLGGGAPICAYLTFLFQGNLTSPHAALCCLSGCARARCASQARTVVS